MKKFILMLLAALLVLGLASVAMAAEACDHSKGWDWKVVEEPTCLEDGLKAKICVKCGSYIKADWTHVAAVKDAATEEIPALPHNAERIETQEATCEEDGLIEGYCTNGCNQRQAVDTIPALGHDMAINVELSKPETCTSTGLLVKTCTHGVCGYTTEEVIDDVKSTEHFGHLQPIFVHNAKEATCLENGQDLWFCNACDKEFVEIIDKYNHVDPTTKKSAWQTITDIDATCCAPGLLKEKCYLCQAVVETARPQLDHNWSVWTIDEMARCESDGMRSSYCLNECCQDRTIKLVKKTEILPATGHLVLVDEDPTEGVKGVCVHCKLNVEIAAPAPEAPVEPETPADPEAPVEPETPVEPEAPAEDEDENDSEGTGSTTGNGSDASIPATGDNGNTMAYIMMVVAAAGLVVLAASKRKVNC